MHWTRTYSTRPGAPCQCCLWQQESILHKTCVVENPALSDVPDISQHCKALVDAGTPFSGEKYVDVILRLKEEFDHRFADFKTHRVTFQIFASPISFDDDAPSVLQMKVIKLQCNSKWSSGRWAEKPTSLGIFWENWPLASFGFPECSSGPCAFLEARTSAKSSSPPWTSISPSTGPDLLMNVFKTYWGSQLLPPSGQTSHDMPIWH